MKKVGEKRFCIFIMIFAFCISISCTTNEVDKLLKEAEKFINNRNHKELMERLTSDNTTVNIRAMAEITRFTIVIEELENLYRDMSVKQLEKYLTLEDDANRILEELSQNKYIMDSSTLIVDAPVDRIQAVIADPSSPYIGLRPEYSFYDQIGSIHVRTRDFPVSSSVSVDMIIGYDLGDLQAGAELIARRLELREFVRRYFVGKYAAELAPEREEELKEEIREILNTRFLDTARARVIIFNRLDVMENF